MVDVAPTGPAILQHLQHVLDGQRHNSSEFARQLQELDERVSELVQRKGETIVQLAQHYLPDMSSEHVHQVFGDVRRELDSILKRKHKRERDLARKIDRIVSRQQDASRQLESVTRELNEKVVQRERLENELTQHLQTNDTFLQLSERTIDAERRLAEHESRVIELNGEADRKLPSYQQSILFQYLWNRHYGTPEYNCGRLIRRLDDWVARLIDYRKYRPSYLFLCTTAERVAEEVKRRRAEFERDVSEMEGIENGLSAELGLDPILQTGTQLGEQRDAMVEELTSLESELEALEDELIELESDEGRFFDDAIDRLRKFLSETETSVLEQRAEQTPEKLDDEIVAEIGYLNEELDDSRESIREMREKRTDAEKLIKGLGYVLRECQNSDFDSDRCYFDPDFDVTIPIDRFLKKEIGRQTLLLEIRKRQHFHPTWVDKLFQRTASILNNETSRAVIRAVAELATQVLIHTLSNKQGRRNRTFTRKKGF